jgi:hypothetical protein
MKAVNSLTSQTRKLLMFSETEMPKDKRLSFIEDIAVLTKDGPLSMLIKQRRRELLDTAENGASISTDCSTSDQDFQ